MGASAATGEVLELLAVRGDADFALRMQRFFPRRIRALGVSNATVVAVANEYLQGCGDVPAGRRLEIAEEVLERAVYHEEVLLAFALLHKVARAQLDDDLLDRAEIWLNRYVSNWAQCDDLCLKLLYPFLCGHLELIPQTRGWVAGESGWTRRAANVAVVKFVRRRVGRVTFELPLAHAFGNTTSLLHDDDVYVQKGCGWLLKVVGQVHPADLADHLRRWHGQMRRETFRYAVEGLDRETRAALLALG
ncbi:DNA alkylation repair protein [Frankia sp. Ag45/Mut15]|uniref:DNA alkylation repair protein n=1 Tax=Frankia umida TaxID=573489 RepID=A0ABT0JSU7_9ACTN|nr:DNA alkylation repair protein [Frankia umida]MCK9874640.1 DNA alkylation repair protein [Frankia umida]